MNVRSAPMWWGLAAVVVAALLVVPLVVGDDDDGAAGFDGYIQSGTCAQPSDDFTADLESEDDAYDVEPYVAVGDDGEPVTLGYYGAPGVPGFGLAAIYTDQQFSMVITDPDTDDAVACGDILRPDADRVRGSRPGRGAAAPGRVERRRRGRGHRAGHASSASWTSRRPGFGSSSPPTPSACRPKRQPGTRATSRAGSASRRAGDVRVELEERGRRTT